jgi:hypothetical protein
MGGDTPDGVSPAKTTGTPETSAALKRDLDQSAEVVRSWTAVGDQPDTDGLRVVVPANPPVLTPAAAHALLTMLIDLGQRQHDTSDSE